MSLKIVAVDIGSRGFFGGFGSGGIPFAVTGFTGF